MSQDEKTPAEHSDPFANPPTEDGSRRSSRFADHPRVRLYRQSYDQRTTADDWVARLDGDAASPSDDESFMRVALHEELRSSSESRERLVNPFEAEADDNVHFNHAIWEATAAAGAAENEESRIGKVEDLDTSTDIHAAAIDHRDILFAPLKRFEGREKRRNNVCKRSQQRKESIVAFGRKTWRKMSAAFRKDSGFESPGSESRANETSSGTTAGQDLEAMPLLSRGRSSTGLSIWPSGAPSKIGILPSVESGDDRGVGAGNRHCNVCPPEYEDVLVLDNDTQNPSVTRTQSKLPVSRPLSQDFSISELNPFTSAEDQTTDIQQLQFPHGDFDQAFQRQHSQGQFSEEAIDTVFAKAPGNSPKYNKSLAAQWKASAVLRAGTTAVREKRDRAFARMQKRKSITSKLFRSRITSRPTANDPLFEPWSASGQSGVGDVVGQTMRKGNSAYV